LRLRSPPAVPIARIARVAVVHSDSSSSGAYQHVRVAASGPAWLVLGESYSKGWRAWCRDGSGHERGLGAPVPIDGFANGWRVGPWCHEARIAFAPQRFANVSYAVSAVGCGALALLVLLGLWRRRRAGDAAAAPDPTDPPSVPHAGEPDPLRRAGWPRA